MPDLGQISALSVVALPKSAQPGAKAALSEIWNAEDREHAEAAVKAFKDIYGAKWPKAAAKVTDDLDVLLAFYDYPAERWVHLRTTNPIESTFATVRLRQRIIKGPGSRAAGIAMAFKLIRVRTDQMARRERAPPRHAGPSRRCVRRGHPHRGTRRTEPRISR